MRSRLLSFLVFAAGALLLYQGVVALDYNWQWHRIWRYFIRVRSDGWQVGPLLSGLAVTMKISVLALLLSVVGGLVLAAMQEARMRSLRWLARSFIEAIRCTPQLVQLYILYFMFSSMLGLSAFAAGVISLGVFEAVFAAEIFRSGYRACPSGQREAARSLGLGSLATARLVVFPQILPLILPSLANLLVNLIKHSAIVTVIAVPDMTDIARNLIADTFLVLELWLAIAVVYWVISYAGTSVIRVWEKATLARISARSRAAA
ncbi:MAG: amino acid ABC transporter permease [Betaproteobacteria bacterium]|nr:amino acid ABC transporter permease [Betaproteobacteria bacterium]